MACVAVLVVGGTLVAQHVSENEKLSSRPTTAVQTGRIGPSAIWLPGADFLKNASAACDRSYNAPADCFINQMANAGAPADAIRFSRRLCHQSGGEFGIMWGFRKLGPVDIAKVLYPLRGSTLHGLLLLNGDPEILDVDDLKRLDRHGLEKDEEYQLLRKDYSTLELWAGDRYGTAWPMARKRKDDGQSFDIYYMLNPVRPVGRWVSGARFDWNFDAQGNFLGTKFTGGVGPLPI